MITKLTKKQEARIEPFKQEWLEYVLSPVEDTTIFSAAKNFYELLGIKNSTVIILDNPIYIVLSIMLLSRQLDNQLRSQLRSQLDSQLCSQLRSQLGNQLRSQLGSQLRSQLNNQLDNQLRSQLDSQLDNQLRSQLYSQLDSQLDSQLRSQLGSQLGSQLDNQLDSQLGNQLYSQLCSQLYSQLDSQLRSQLGSQLGNQLYNQLDSQLYSQLGSQLGNQLDNQLGSQLDNQLYSQLDNQLYSWYPCVYWASNAGYYTFVREIGVGFNERAMDICSELVSHVHVCFPFKNVVFCSRKPITRWKNGLLHDEYKPAVEFKGGWHIWCLNGVKVSREIVETPPEKLDAKILLQEKNAEVRREIVRKIGMEKVCSDLKAKCIDAQGDYELLMLDIGDNRRKPYLKMKNPSLGVYHIEGVAPECVTVEKALNFRNGSTMKPEVLT